MFTKNMKKSNNIPSQEKLIIKKLNAETAELISKIYLEEGNMELWQPG